MTKDLLKIYSWVTYASLALLGGLSAAKKPNILLILADDTGYTDLGAFAERITGTPTHQQLYETPNLDKLVGEGTAFQQAYACPLCSPTRSSILTGRYAGKIGFTTATPGSVRTFYNQGIAPPPGYLAQDAIYWGDSIREQQALWNGSSLQALPSGQANDLGRDAITLAEALNQDGYRSAFIGKWHLGGHGSKGYEPHDQGFEEIAYIDAGGSVYFDWRKIWDNHKPVHPRMPQDKLYNGKSGKETGEKYLTDDLSAQASAFIRSHVKTRGGQPFFLYFCQLALHGPIQAKKEDVDYFESKPTKGWNNHTNATYAGMVKSLDESVGSLVDVLKETDQLENTLIVFMSDNGGVSWPMNQQTRADDSRATWNAPLKGGKAMLFEGGIRVPLFFYWKGKIKGGQWVDRAVDCNDIFPTILEMAGVDVKPYQKPSLGPAIDGQSLVGLIENPTGEQTSYDRDTFFWHYPFNVIVHNPVDGMPLAPHSAIRKGPHKLIYDWSGRLWLYNIDEDISETQNLAGAKPELTRALFSELNEWLGENVADKYLPTLNPGYNPASDGRSYPFVDYRALLLGDSYKIKPKPRHSVNNLHK
ncbi:MAG: sulfatase [Verrucomicrobia bacterium]|nr:sulfatase [Verrucomicrobiota bacterium]MDA1066557.1 sulfatase [Verrucomicrobiota bacterium]